MTEVSLAAQIQWARSQRTLLKKELGRLDKLSKPDVAEEIRAEIAMTTHVETTLTSLKKSMEASLHLLNIPISDT